MSCHARYPVKTRATHSASSDSSHLCTAAWNGHLLLQILSQFLFFFPIDWISMTGELRTFSSTFTLTDHSILINSVPIRIVRFFFISYPSFCLDWSILICYFIQLNEFLFLLIFEIETSWPNHKSMKSIQELLQLNTQSIIQHNKQAM